MIQATWNCFGWPVFEHKESKNDIEFETSHSPSSLKISEEQLFGTRQPFLDHKSGNITNKILEIKSF